MITKNNMGFESTLWKKQGAFLQENEVLSCIDKPPYNR